MRVVTSSFDQAAAQLRKKVKTNTEAFGRSIADTFLHTARRRIEWTDRTGRARRGLFAEVKRGTYNVEVKMGGRAENYKRKSPYEDYMELLEFGHESHKRNFPDLSVVFPTYQDIIRDFRRQYGQAAVSGGTYSLNRSKAAARARAKAQRARRRGQRR